MERVLGLNFLLGLSHPLVPLESLEGGTSIGAGVKSATHSRGRRAGEGDRRGTRSHSKLNVELSINLCRF